MALTLAQTWVGCLSQRTLTMNAPIPVSLTIMKATHSLSTLNLRPLPWTRQNMGADERERRLARLGNGSVRWGFAIGL